MQAHQWKALQHGLHFDRSQRTPSPAQFLAELTGRPQHPWFNGKGPLYAGAAGIGVVLVAVVAGLYFHGITAPIGQRPGPGVEAARPSAGEANVTPSASAGARQAQRKAAEAAAAQQAQQKAAEAAAAQQAQQKAAEAAAAQQAQQKAAEAAATQKPQPGTDQNPIGPPQIVEAQRLLTSMGLDTGGTDGKVGPRTQEMVRAFQSAIGEPPTGEITVALLASLRRPSPPPAARANSLFALAARPDAPNASPMQSACTMLP
jgi:hypothetical protein